MKGGGAGFKSFDGCRRVGFWGGPVKQVLPPRGRMTIKEVRLELGELAEIGLPDIAAEGEVGAAAFALNADEAGIG